MSRSRAVEVPLRHEQGPPRPESDRDVAVLAHWSPQPQLSRSVERLLEELLASGYACALVSASPSPSRLTASDPELLARVSVLRRPNVGYDFGSWAAFLHVHPEVRRADRVLLLNDSLIGPFASLTSIIDGFTDCPTQIWGLVGTTQDRPHLQSHVMGYKDGVLDDSSLRRFWDGVREERTTTRIVHRYEIGLSRLAQREGILTAAHFPWQWVTSRGQNPTSLGWRRLIAMGFPFVKRELVRNPPPEVVDTADIPQVVRERWGEDVHAWL